MSIKVYKPTINSRRNMSVTDYSELSKVAPERSLFQRTPAETATEESPSVIAAAETAESTA